jgi:sigma-B regulation protein RsbU (phosphoserine phosphatase)
MLPTVLPGPPGVDIAARSEASTELAGDFYDAFMIEGRVGLLVGDVVGKGVAAALMMSAVRASLRAYAHGSVEVDEVMTLTNEAMCRDTLDNEFATLWYGVLDPATGDLDYASAGHDPPFVVRVPTDRPVDETDVRPLGVGGLVLGVDPVQHYAAFRHRLEPGDVLIAYTDGLTDARTFDDEKFGWSRLLHSVIALLRDEPDASAERVLEHVMWDVRRYVGLREQVDDETMLVMRYRGPNASAN